MTCFKCKGNLEEKVTNYFGEINYLAQQIS